MNKMKLAKSKKNIILNILRVTLTLGWGYP